MVTMTVRPPKHLDYLEVKDFSHVLGTADGSLCHLNSYTALQCSWHSNIRSGFPRTRCSCISSFSAANEGAVSLQGISTSVPPSGGGCSAMHSGKGWDWRHLSPNLGRACLLYIYVCVCVYIYIYICIFFFPPHSFGIWSQTKSTQLSLGLLTKNQSKYMKASMQWFQLTAKTFTF